MTYRFTRDDVEFLARADLADLAELETATIRDIERARARYGDRSGAVVETVVLRRRSVAKIEGGEHWLYTDEGLQQATPTAVARHRAARLAGRVVHDVTCSIGAELAALTGVASIVVGSDLDDIRLRMARHNVPEAAVLQADALHPVTRDAVIVADPARRAGGGRVHDPAKLQPPLPDLLDTYAGRDLAVKCAPGLDFDRLGWPGEVEVVSLDGSVREACLWSEGLTGNGVRRRATVLGVEAITDAEPDDIPARAPGAFIVNPDGAIVRAGLVRHYAARHGLWQLDPQIAYLTGDAVPQGTRGFRIVEQVKFTEKIVRQALTRVDCGPLEILVRGVDVDPDVLRKRLKLRGTRPYSLVVTRIGRTAAAFVTSAV